MLLHSASFSYQQKLGKTIICHIVASSPRVTEPRSWFQSVMEGGFVVEVGYIGCEAVLASRDEGFYLQCSWCESLEYLKTVPLHHHHHLVDYPGSGTYIALDLWMNTSFSLCFMDASEDFNKKMHVSYSNGFEVLDLQPGKTSNL